ncbi:MAG: hypothetical protein INR68_17565 [Methylobacterium mesophilicum]|nr:hypothetical protein [Methylobacterium mesophilicum]
MLLGAGLAQAQSMSPMRGRVASYSDEFALKVFPRNIYPQRIDFEVHAYDQDFQPIDATILPQTFTLAAGGVRPVTVIIPFAGATERKVRVCAESVPFPTQSAQIKTRICGKFLAQRLQ